MIEMAPTKRKARPAPPSAWHVTTEADGFTRRRFRGQGRKGPPGALREMARDVRLALGELQAAHELLHRAADITDRDARARAHRTALDKIGLAARALDDILIRRGRSVT